LPSGYCTALLSAVAFSRPSAQRNFPCVPGFETVPAAGGEGGSSRTLFYRTIRVFLYYTAAAKSGFPPQVCRNSRWYRGAHLQNTLSGRSGRTMICGVRRPPANISPSRNGSDSSPRRHPLCPRFSQLPRLPPRAGFSAAAGDGELRTVNSGRKFSSLKIMKDCVAAAEEAEPSAAGRRIVGGAESGARVTQHGDGGPGAARAGVPQLPFVDSLVNLSAEPSAFPYTTSGEKGRGRGRRVP
jgi:hypothetical protein